ncbi:hypothetical protein PVAND_010254 [Polypedilum vanderplanki]|uniref:U3 small nucleolar RNA-interacting protein 2 n=1 Tax=Polypedilum vanderplanki TaxID=319348 RepID=A0A9J6CFT8_POLVA|nr:hypothetical protein PVAND_010254 [Polypedilum vanderplanki]
MSFFVRTEKSSKKNQKFTSVKRKIKKQDNDEELDSETEELNGTHKSFPEISDDEDLETPDAKRLRLAKQHLNEIRKSDDEDEDVSKKLKFEYLDSIGKLKRNIAENITGYDDQNIVTLKHKLQNHPLTCLCLAPNNDKILFSGCKSGKVLKWDIEAKKSIGNISLDSHIMCIAIPSDFKFLVISDRSHKIYIYDPDSLKKIHTFGGHRGVVTGLAFRKDSHQMFSCSEDRTVRVWSLDEMVYVETLFGHQNPVTSIDALYKERALTAGGNDETLRIWKIVEESQLVFNGGHLGSVDCVKFISEETFLSCGDDGTLAVWSSSKKKPISSQKFAHGTVSTTGVANWISSIATLVNTDLIASGSCDGHIRIWKLNNNNREIELKFEIPVCGFVNSLQFTSDGSHIIAAIGQEHRLGRWWKLKEAKNTILVIPLKKIE